MTFRIGQKVVFVGGERHPNEWGAKPFLRKGEIYTIREVDATYIDYFGFAGIRLIEHTLPKLAWRGGATEPAVLAYKFRPIVERKTDISIFTKMLTDKRVAA